MSRKIFLVFFVVIAGCGSVTADGAGDAGGTGGTGGTTVAGDGGLTKEGDPACQFAPLTRPWGCMAGQPCVDNRNSCAGGGGTCIGTTCCLGCVDGDGKCVGGDSAGDCGGAGYDCHVCTGSNFPLCAPVPDAGTQRSCSSG